MLLTGKQRNYLRGLAHHLKPVIMVGEAGVTQAVFEEIKQALDHHELIKIKLRVGDRSDRRDALENICHETGAEAVQEIGQIAVIFRAAPEPKINLPK
jgi:RNA-binding protein